MSIFVHQGFMAVAACQNLSTAVPVLLERAPNAPVATGTGQVVPRRAPRSSLAERRGARALLAGPRYPIGKNAVAGLAVCRRPCPFCRRHV